MFIFWAFFLKFWPYLRLVFNSGYDGVDQKDMTLRSVRQVVFTE